MDLSRFNRGIIGRTCLQVLFLGFGSGKGRVFKLGDRCTQLGSGLLHILGSLSHFCHSGFHFLQSSRISFVLRRLGNRSGKDDVRTVLGNVLSGKIFFRNGSFFRAGTAEFDGKEFLLLSNIDDPKFAALGIMEDVDVLSLDLEPERIEKAVRYAFGIEPYPEKYPDY